MATLVVRASSCLELAGEMAAKSFGAQQRAYAMDQFGTLENCVRKIWRAAMHVVNRMVRDVNAKGTLVPGVGTFWWERKRLKFAAVKTRSRGPAAPKRPQAVAIAEKLGCTKDLVTDVLIGGGEASGRRIIR